MPKGSDALIASRKEEIVSACAQLYENMGFKEITLGDIGKRTSFTRTSIYNYFQTKEEIFLALLQREYEAWISDLEAKMAKQRTLSADALAGMLADTLQRRRCMLKLMSMNLYDMEGNSRMENLVAFKRVYARSMMTVSRCLQSWMPAMKEEDIQDFLYAFFPFLFGVYPYTEVTEKQEAAMAAAQVSYGRYSIREIIYAFVIRLLRSFC